MPVYARRSARVLLVDSADRVLLLRSLLKPGKPARGHLWLTPGGGVEPGEDLAEAAVRELAEEAGLTASAADLRHVAFAAGHAEFTWASGLFRDDYFLHRVGSHRFDPSGQTEFERGHMVGHRWWSAPELQTTTETIYPYGLSTLLTDLIGGRVPAEPVELPWHH
jgi:8-oxo-dGTP pyrophosphatase MutT (NUDIX family)